MACPTSLPSSRGKRLFELLEEQQEPFLMDNISLQRRRGGQFKCMLSKFLRENFIRKALKWDDKAPGSRSLGKSSPSTGKGISKMDDDDKEPSDLQISLSTGSISGVSDGEASWKCLDEDVSKQLSPVSVLGMHSCEGSEDTNREEEMSTFSLELQRKASDIFEEILQVAYTPAFDQLTKADVLQPPQLRGKDAEESVTDSHECSKHHGELGIVSRLTVAELSKSWGNWIGFRPQVTVTVVEVDDAIFECMIEETVLEMLIGFF